MRPRRFSPRKISVGIPSGAISTGFNEAAAFFAAEVELLAHLFTPAA